MQDYEAADLVTAISQVDDRITPSEGTVAFWFGAIGDLDYRDALNAAATHYGRTRDRIMPSDVRDGVREIIRARVSAIPRVDELMADVDPRDPDYHEIFKARRAEALRRAAGYGPDDMPALSAAPDPGGPR
jgi:hypothetical protein